MVLLLFYTYLCCACAGVIPRVKSGRFMKLLPDYEHMDYKDVYTHCMWVAASWRIVCLGLHDDTTLKQSNWSCTSCDMLFTELPACCEKRRQLSWCATCAVLKLYCLEHRVLVWSLLKHLGLLMINLKKIFYVAMQHQRNFNKNQNVHEVGFI